MSQASSADMVRRLFEGGKMNSSWCQHWSLSYSDRQLLEVRSLFYLFVCLFACFLPSLFNARYVRTRYLNVSVSSFLVSHFFFFFSSTKSPFWNRSRYNSGLLWLEIQQFLLCGYLPKRVASGRLDEIDCNWVFSLSRIDVGIDATFFQLLDEFVLVQYVRKL